MNGKEISGPDRGVLYSFFRRVCLSARVSKLKILLLLATRASVNVMSDNFLLLYPATLVAIFILRFSRAESRARLVHGNFLCKLCYMKHYTMMAVVFVSKIFTVMVSSAKWRRRLGYCYFLGVFFVSVVKINLNRGVVVRYRLVVWIRADQKKSRVWTKIGEMVYFE